MKDHDKARAFLRAAALVISLCLFLLPLAACSRGNDVTVVYGNILSKADTLDPQAENSDGAETLILNLFEGLTRIDENGAVIPGAAANWTVSPDGLTYVFNLRNNGKWYFDESMEDGLTGLTADTFDARVTAADFVFAFRRAVDPATKCSHPEVFEGVKGADKILAGTLSPDKLSVFADGDYTLRVELSAPRADFLRHMAEPAAMPCSEAFFNACSGRYGRRLATTTANGTFCLTRLREDAGVYSYRLSRNPVYEGPRPASVDYVWLYQNSDRDAIMSSMREDEYNFAFADSYRLSLIDPAAFTVAPVEDTVTCFIFNLNSPAVFNANTRRAFAAATEIGELCELLGAEAVSSPIPAYCLTAADSRLPSGDDPVEFVRAALNDLGEPSITLDLLAPESAKEPLKRIQQIWQSRLTVAVNININTVPDKDLPSELRNGEYDIAFAPIRTKSRDSAEFLTGFCAGGEYSRSFGIVLPAFDVKVGAAKKSGSDTDLTAATDALLSTCCVVPVCRTDSAIVTSDGLTGIYTVGGEARIMFDRAVFG